MAQAIPIIITAVTTVASSYMQGQTAKKAASDQADILEYNAAVSRADAAAEKEAAKVEAEQIARQAKITKGQQLLYYGNSGFTQSGTPLSIMADTAHQFKLDEEMALWRGDIGASRQMSQGSIYNMSAAAQRKSGQAAFNTSMLNGISSAAGSYVNRRY